MKSITVIAISIMLFGFACSDSSTFADSAVNPNSSKLAVKSEAPTTNEEELEQINSRKLIKNGFVKFRVDNLIETREKISALANTLNGYISKDEQSKFNSRTRQLLVVRVPSKNFDRMLEGVIYDANKIDEKQISVNDVTEEFLDVEARLKTKKELEARYLNLLTKAKSIKEILDIEKQIGELRAEIESNEGRLNYLKNQVSFLTLRIEFYKELVSQSEFWYNFKNSLNSGWENLQIFIIALTKIWPFIILALLIPVFLRYRKKGKNKK